MISDLIAFIALGVVILILILDNVRVRIKRRNTATMLLQQTLDKVSLLEHIEKLTKDSQAKNIEQTEGFLKFVSDSRDWAFNYIEEVQKALKEFDQKVTPELIYAKTYGTAVESHLATTVKAIDDAYAELLKVLPEDNN